MAIRSVQFRCSLRRNLFARVTVFNTGGIEKDRVTSYFEISDEKCVSFKKMIIRSKEGSWPLANAVGSRRATFDTYK